MLYWRDLEKPQANKLSKSDKKKTMRMEEITEIRHGRIGPNFDRFKLTNEGEKYRENLSFSIVGPKRTLDLEAKDELDREIFECQLDIVMSYAKSKERTQMERKQRAKAEDYHRSTIKTSDGSADRK